jgi:large subunit ribosomal protein L6
MSRVGKYPVAVPKGVTVSVVGQELSVKGKLGTSVLRLVDDVEVKVEGDRVVVNPRADTKRARIMWGTTRAHINNMVKGVVDGFKSELEINGVGYRAAVQGKNLILQLGYSHEIAYAIPADIVIRCEKPTAITVTGRDRQRVGQVAAEIRAFRAPEPYKGKGVKYAAEHIRRKEGKKK